jgi:hypothetical protein
LLFAALWFSGAGVWEIFWYAILGEGNGPSPVKIAQPTSTIVALLISLIVYLRLIAGFASDRFLRITVFYAFALSLFFAVALASKFASRISGWSARGAAENCLAGLPHGAEQFIDPNSAPRILEAGLPAEFQHAAGKSRRFVLYYGPTPIREAYFSAYGRWWWTATSSRSLFPSANVYQKAEKLWNKDSSGATALLEAIIRDYPNSEASRRAEALLDDLRSRPNEGVKGAVEN